jgi:hypothetical protein
VFAAQTSPVQHFKASPVTGRVVVFELEAGEPSSSSKDQPSGPLRATIRIQDVASFVFRRISINAAGCRNGSRLRQSVGIGRRGRQIRPG